MDCGCWLSEGKEVEEVSEAGSERIRLKKRLHVIDHMIT